MMVSFQVGNKSFEIGSSDFLHSFFSTVFVRLENNRWGSRFPVLMNHLYTGNLSTELSSEAKEELKKIKFELAEFSPDEVVWDFENRSLTPSWKNEISEQITDLSNYFVTSNGKQLIYILDAALSESERSGKNVIIG
jgi:2,3-bisphosphoglycerate-dependent phosphoglycerate mutase